MKRAVLWAVTLTFSYSKMLVISSTNNKFAVLVLRVSRWNSTRSSLVVLKGKSGMTHCNATVLTLGPAYLLFRSAWKCCSSPQSWNLLATCHLIWLIVPLSYVRCLTANRTLRWIITATMLQQRHFARCLRLSAKFIQKGLKSLQLFPFSEDFKITLH
jgi:hypothetical protein